MSDILIRGMEMPKNCMACSEPYERLSMHRKCYVDGHVFYYSYGYGRDKDCPLEVRGVGKWIERDDYDWDIYYECSVCHTPFTMLDGTTPELNDYHYCPNCGAKMEVSEDA